MNIQTSAMSYIGRAFVDHNFQSFSIDTCVMERCFTSNTL